MEQWTEQDEKIYGPLRRKKLRLEAKERRDQNRKKKYGVRHTRTDPN